MTGEYEVNVRNKYVEYTFKVNRKISLLTGASATGKTSLVDALRNDFSVVTSTVEVYAPLPKDVYSVLSSVHNSIIVLDEECSFLGSDAFSTAAKVTDNYLVLITRKNLEALPFSILSIFEFKERAKSAGALRPMYLNFAAQRYRDNKKTVLPSKVIVEDSNSGYEFFSKSLSCPVISAEGKSNVEKVLMAEVQRGTNGIAVIVDGAAFGSCVEGVMSIYKVFGRKLNIVVLAPESFEWLLLKFAYSRVKAVQDRLVEPWKFCDVSKYFSLERYFTSLLTQAGLNNVPKRYTKSELNPYFLRYSDSVLKYLGLK